MKLTVSTTKLVKLICYRQVTGLIQQYSFQASHRVVVAEGVEVVLEEGVSNMKNFNFVNRCQC